jgi:two-component system, OmpR family, response regulator BaeR
MEMIMSKRILIVEDEPRISEVILAYLQHAGYEADLVERGDQVIAAVVKSPPALLLLDLMLPGVDGITICRDIRKHFNFPIIMVTARVEEIDKLLGFDVGADDYLCKPFSPNELVARVRVHMRRSYGEQTASLSHSFANDTDAQRIYCAGQLLNLTPQEYRLLSIFIASPSRIFSRKQLLDLAYNNDTEIFDRTIDSHIKNLRKRLKPTLGEAEAIHSVYGVGYRFELA